MRLEGFWTPEGPFRSAAGGAWAAGAAQDVIVTAAVGAQLRKRHPATPVREASASPAGSVNKTRAGVLCASCRGGSSVLVCGEGLLVPWGRDKNLVHARW